MLLARPRPTARGISPRGDPAGLVHALDEGTLLVPGRPGNRLADSLPDILQAFIRSDLWNPETFVDASALPTPGEIHRSLNPAFDAETYDSSAPSATRAAKGCTENVPVPG